MGVQAQANMLREDLVLLLAEHGIDLPGESPGGGAVFFPFPRPAPVSIVQTQGHSIRSRTS